jgi:two-component system, OmpR family, response regulator
MKILLLEDDIALREIVSDELKRLGYKVYPFKNGDTAMDSLLEVSYDLMLLDINVPGIDGYEFLKMLREMDSKTPVIFMSSYTDMDHLTKGYEIGCNDYLRKPFSLKELELRINELIKRETFNAGSDLIALENGFAYDTQKGLLFHNDDEVDLTSKEHLFITYIIARRGTIVDTNDILEYVWDGEGNTNSLRVLISKLKKKLGFELVKNIKNMGYRIN